MNHDHKYFIFQVKAEFELAEPFLGDDRQLWERVEYAVLGCNCGEVIKQKVKQGNE